VLTSAPPNIADTRRGFSAPRNPTFRFQARDQSVWTSGMLGQADDSSREDFSLRTAVPPLRACIRVPEPPHGIIAHYRLARGWLRDRCAPALARSTFVDLNHLLYHHQLSLIRAKSLSSDAGSGALRLVRHYQTRIDRLRHQLGVTGYPAWCTAPGLAGAVS